MASDPENIAHLLRRTGFTAPDAKIAELSALDWPAAVDRVLDTTANPPEDLPPETLVWNQSTGYESYVALVHWWLDRCASTPTPIVEKMTLFWHGHFTTSFSKVYNLPAILSQHRLYRSLALGDFTTLAQRMAVEPAMLWYLDNSENTAASPNQNFARELMELFLLGVGNYTESDVVSAARAWTGYTTPAWDDPTTIFRPEEHDHGTKTFFGRDRNWDGPEIISEILSTGRLTVARFIARKLWEFFAYQNPSQTVVDAIAQAFIDSNLNVGATLRVLFNRPEFVSVQAKQGLVRTPIEFVVATLHHTGLPAAVAHPEWWLEDMGQAPFNPPNVSGWRPNAYWINTSALTGREQFAGYAAWKLMERGWWSDLDNRSVDNAIDHGAATLGLSLSSVTRAALSNWLTRQRSSSERWNERANITTLLLVSPEMNMA